VEEASHDAAATPPTQVVGEAGQAATDVPSADMAGEVRDVGMSMGAVGSHAIRTVDFSQPTLPLGQALELPPGTVVELDQGAESPIELFVNGTRFAHGTLLDADGEWAVQIDALV
jgi:flagellar motor switch protein FliN/FliY